MQAFYPLKFKLSAPKASRPGSTSIFPCPWRRQSACKPAKKSSGNCWIALNYTWYENSYLSSKPLKGQAKATKLLCRPPQNRLPKTNGAAAPTQVAPDPPVRENLIHDFLSAYEILGLGFRFSNSTWSRPTNTAMQINIYHVDAFTNRLFGGNPAAVCPLNSWISVTTMQEIATENNLSETAFFVPKGEDFEIRWFTPVAEIDLAGHPTLATAYVILEILDPGRAR